MKIILHKPHVSIATKRGPRNRPNILHMFEIMWKDVARSHALDHNGTSPLLQLILCGGFHSNISFNPDQGYLCDMFEVRVAVNRGCC